MTKDRPDAIALKPEERHKKGKKERRRNQDGAKGRRTRPLLMLVLGSHGAVFSVVLTSDLITRRRLPDQKPLRIRNMLSSWLGCQICLNYMAHCKPAVTPHLLPVLK